MADSSKQTVFGFPFDSKEIYDDISQKLVDDRVYLARDFALFFKQFIGNGIYANPADGCKVVSSGFMGITIREGHGFVDGYHGYIKEPVNLVLDTGIADNPRIDRVVLRLNLLDRIWEVAIRKGTPASNPQPPELQRYVGDAGNYYELGLATIRIEKNAVSITDAEITDTRLDDSVCGIVAGVIDQIDMTDLYRQFESFLEQSIQNWENIKQQQEAKWNQQLQKQQEDFEVQLASQKTDFDTIFNTINAWYATVKNNIAKLQTFDFDNLASMTGVTRKTTEAGEVITEEIFNTISKQKVAVRETNTTTLTQIITLYDDTGLPVLPKKQIATSTSVPGAIAEEIVTDINS